MTLTELRYIVAVAKAKHFGKAAEDCCVSQPTLSVGIRKLEDSLGVSIFERGRSEVRITPIGQVIINQAQNVLNEALLIREIAQSEKDQLAKPIKIASTHTVGKYLFPYIINQAYNFSSKLSLLFNQDYKHLLLHKLKKEDLDIIILSCDNNKNIELDPDLTSEKILTEDLYLVAHEKNKYASSSNLCLSDILLEDLLLLNKQHCFYDQVLALNSSWNLNKVNDTNFDNLEALYNVLKIQSGATIVPALFNSDVVAKDNNNIKVIPIENPKPTRDIHLVWRKNYPRAQVLDIIKDCLGNLNVAGLEVVAN